MVGAQRVTGGHQVNNGISQPRQWGQLHAAVQLDQVNMHALGSEKFTRDRHVFCGHLQTRALLDRPVVIKTRPHRHTDAALGDLQIQRSVQAFSAGLQQRVFADHAHVRTTVLHVSGHVGGAHQQHAHVALVGVKNQLTGLFGVVQHFDTGAFEQRQNVVEDSAFGQCNGDHALSLSMQAPTPRSLASIWS